jgi:hypothetical protein
MEGHMPGVIEETRIELVEERLRKGAEILFDMELRGELGAQYDRYLQHFTELLERYETRRVA